MRIGTVRGRHDMPVFEYIFDKSVIDPTDLDLIYRKVAKALYKFRHVDLYVTGLTVVTTTAIKYCFDKGISISLWHYDIKKGEYYEQVIFSKSDVVIKLGQKVG